MKEHHYNLIQKGLETILTKGGNGNFAIFELPQRKNQYIQVAAEKNGNNLWVEAGYKEELSEQQHKLLGQMGWETPEEAGLINYSKQIPIQSIDECALVAEMIMDTFATVYKLSGDEEIVDKINLE